MSEIHEDAARFPVNSVPTDRVALDESVLDAWRFPVAPIDEFTRMGVGREHLDRSQLMYLMKFGLLAPTSHNTVPQRFRFGPKPGEISIGLDRAFVLPQSDPSGRQATVSCGCVMAAIAMAAGAYGWRSEVEPVPTEMQTTGPQLNGCPRHTELARISFSPTDEPVFGPQWLTAMIERKVVRAEYDPSVPLTESVADEMLQVVSKYATVRMHLLSDAPSLMVLAKFQELADTTVLNREVFARELGEWLLPNDNPSPRGMRGREFGLDDEAALHIHLGLRGLGRLLPDEVSAFAKTGKLGVRSASAVVVLTVQNDTVAARLEAGRAYMELAVLLQLRGYVVSMHAAITEVESANLALRGRLRTLARPVVVFRAGKPAKPADGLRPHAARPSLLDLVLPDVPVPM